MQENEIFEFCKEKNIILDSYLSKVFLDLEEKESLIYFLEKIKLSLGKKFISKSLIEDNLDKISVFLKELSIRNEKDSDFLKERFKIVDYSPPKEIRYEDLKNYMQDKKELDNLISIGKLSDEKQKFSVIGLVSSKRTSKNNNVILEIEDLTGKMKVVVSSDKEDLMKECEDIALDSVIGFKGFGSKEIMFVNEIIFPDTRLEDRKKAHIEEYVAFIGDLHLGSKRFLEEDFLKFIDFLNDVENKDFDVKKIKYLIFVGDLITGVGNYPNQEPDLKIVDLEQQFQYLANLLSKIRKDIQIVISPGNHDCVRLMEPQPLLDEKYAWPLYELSNVVMVGNPTVVNIGERQDFPGFDILIYHGFSFPYYANNIPKLMLEKTMNEPEKIMKYLLKNRHLAPSHGSNQYFPMEKDPLLIRKAPDILVSGHTHKSGVSYYNNILIVSSSSWEGFTPYQEKFGNEPDHCKVPVFNLKTRAVKILDFESENEDIKTFNPEEDGK
jgi:DNA polymerase II small subunit